MAEFSRRPMGVTCHICGRAYGTASIAIHLKSCEAAFLSEEAKKPASQRRPVPAAPVDLSASATGGGRIPTSVLEAYNASAAASYKTNAMSKCQHCGRAFVSDRLPIHQRSCTAENPARRVGQSLPGGGGGAFKDEDGKSEEEEEPEYAPSPVARPRTVPSPAATRREPAASSRAPAAATPSKQTSNPAYTRAYSSASYDEVDEDGAPALNHRPARPTTAKLIGSSREEPEGRAAIQHISGPPSAEPMSGATSNIKAQIAALQAQLSAVRRDMNRQLDQLERTVAAISSQL